MSSFCVIRRLQDEPDKGCAEINSHYVCQGAIPKASASARRSHLLNPKNAEPFKISDDLHILDSTTASNSVNEFDFNMLDLRKSMFTSEDHTEILMQADNLLQATKRQLLDLQVAMKYEEGKFQIESNPSTSSFSRDDGTQPGRDVASENVEGIQSDSKANGDSFSASKQKKQDLIDPKESKNKKSILVRNYMRKKPRKFTEQPCIINSLPSSRDIEKEIRITQASLRGGLSAAKGVSALLETMVGKEGKEIQVHNSGFEIGNLSNIKFQRRQQDTQVPADNDVHLASQSHTISISGDASQRRENDPIANVTNQAGMPDLTLDYEKCNTRTATRSDMYVCTNQLHEFQSEDPHSQPLTCGCEHVASKVKKPPQKLETDGSAACKSTDTKVSAQYCNNASCHMGACKCHKPRAHSNPCNSAVLHLKASFSSEENRDPQPGKRLVVQTLPSLTIKRDLSIQKVPSVSIPSPDAPPFVPTQQNVGLCKMSHSQVQMEPNDCSLEILDHKKGTDNKVSEVKPTVQGKTRKHNVQKHGHYRGSSPSSELGKRNRMIKESTHHDLLFQAVPLAELGTVKYVEREGNVLTEETKGGHCITGHGTSHDELKLPAESEYSHKKPQCIPNMSPLKQQSTEHCQTSCERCGNGFVSRDLYFGVCGKCRNIPPPKLETKHHRCGSTSDVIKAAAVLNQCSACLRHFPESELFHGHCIQCQLVKKEMRLYQCNMCLNSVPSTEYNNGKCNRCHYKFKFDNQKDEVGSYPAVHGSAMYRMLNTVFDGTSLFFDINNAQGTNRSLPISENMSVQNKKENSHLSGTDKESTQNCIVKEARAETQGFIVNNRTSKNSVRNSKAQFLREEYLISSDNENKLIRESVDVFRQKDKQALKFRKTQSEKLKSYDDHETHTVIRAADNLQETPYFGEEGGGNLSWPFGLKNYDEDASSGSNGPTHVGTKAACDSIISEGGSSATNGNTGSGITNSDTEPEVSQDSSGCSRMYVPVPRNVRFGSTEQELRTHVYDIATVQKNEDLSKETPKLAHTDFGKKLCIMDNALHQQLCTSNRGDSDSEVLQCDAKAFELHGETDGASSRIYSDKYDRILESLSDVKAGNGSGVEGLDCGRISSSSAEESMQLFRHHRYDHSESLQVVEKPKYFMSKSKSNAASGKTSDYSQIYYQNTAKYDSGTASNESRKHSNSEYHHHYFNDDYYRKKPVHAEKDVRVEEPLELLRAVAISKKSSAFKNGSKDDDNEEKQHVVTVSVIEDELLQDTLEQAGEGNGKDVSPDSSESPSETKNVETSLADNTSVNEDDVYEDDWEEEPEEEKDFKEDGKERDDIGPQSIEKTPHVSGDDTEDISKADNEAAIFVDPSGLPQEQPCHSCSTSDLIPCTDETHEKTIPCTVMTSVNPVCSAKAANMEHYQKSIYVADDISDLNISPIKRVDKGSSPIHIPNMKSVSRETSLISMPPMEHTNEGPSFVGISEKKCVDRETFPTVLSTDKAKSTISIQTDKPVDKSTSPVLSPSLKLTVHQRKDSCANVCSRGVQIGELVHGVPLRSAVSASSDLNLQFTRKETQFPVQTETTGDSSKTHPEGYKSSDNGVEPLDTAAPVENINRIDTEIQTDAVGLLMGLHNDETETGKRKKHGHLTCVPDQLDDEESSASASQQEVLPARQEADSQSSSSSSPNENGTQMNGMTASTSDEHVAPSDGECLVSGSACSVGELFVSDVHEEDCSHHTGSHSIGEVWNCHCFETHCMCSEGEIVVNDSIHRGQCMHWKQQESSIRTVNGITGHSSVPVEEDLDSSEGMDDSIPSADVTQLNAERRHKRRNEGPRDRSCMGSTSRSEGELSEGQILVWHR